VPKIVPKHQAKKPKASFFDCPNCKASISAEFDGEIVHFKHGSAEFSKCEGIYESVIVECPKCKSMLEFSKEELEGG
jgi:ssDNA-binding Zn-finger/Zn-ribbon topoisomerase 1